MTEAEWLTSNDLNRMWEVARAFPDRKLRLFLCRIDLRDDASEVTRCEEFADGVLPARHRIGCPIEQYFEDQAWWNAYSGLLAGGDIVAGADRLRAIPVPLAGEVASLARCVFGNPYRPVAFLPEWRTGTAVALAQAMYEGRDFGAMPILADALEDAGCAGAAVLTHCREPGRHVRGCWVTDGLLNKS